MEKRARKRGTISCKQRARQTVRKADADGEARGASPVLPQPGKLQIGFARAWSTAGAQDASCIARTAILHAFLGSKTGV